jgi:hypothetical protein
LNTPLIRIPSSGAVLKIVGLSLFLFVQTVYAEPLSSPIEVVSRDMLYILKTPSSLDSKGIVRVLSFTALTAGLYANKEEVNRGIQILLGADPARSQRSLHGFKFLGDHGVVAGIGAIFIVGGLELDSQREVETGIMILESYLFTGLLTGLGQFIFAEQRPNEGGEVRFLKSDGHGISGHAAIAASLAGPVIHQYLERDQADSRDLAVIKEIARISLVGLPFMTGLSRIEEDLHYAWNVLLGLAIGFGTGHLVARSHEEARAESLGEGGEGVSIMDNKRSKIEWGPMRISYVF